MSNIVEFVNNQKELFLPAVVDNAVKWEKECQFAVQLFQANDFLAKIALSNQVSAQNAIINVAAIGVSLNPALKHAYLIPRKGRVCLDISYMGLLHLAMESGSIMWGQAVLVHERDDFKLTGLGNLPHHDYSPFSDRGNIVGVYCTVKTRDGDFLTECMSIDEIYSIRDRSESFKKKQGPWVTDEGEMIKKTVVKRANKYWPKVERLSNAIEYLNNESGEGFEKEPVMPHYSEKEVSDLKKKADEKFVDDIGLIIESMNKSKTSEELKGHFANAFRQSKCHPINKTVQSIYTELKGKFNE
ncbi:recombinase RecT [Vibrio casei]|uniref:recombinase RecT n=1 Tax=Vibrio casei TaxID=673372 RepID=UPI003F9820CC